MRLIAILAALAALTTAPAAGAADYTLNVADPLDLGSVASGASGDTVFRINPSTGTVTVQSGSGRRLSTNSVRSEARVICKPSRPDDNACNTENVSIRIGTIGPLIGRARANASAS